MGDPSPDTHLSLDYLPGLLVTLVFLESVIEAFLQYVGQVVVLWVASNADTDLKQEYQNETNGEGQHHARAFAHSATAAQKRDDKHHTANHHQQNRGRPEIFAYRRTFKNN